MGERRSAYMAIVGKPQGRRPLGRARYRWEDNIKMDLREVEFSKTSQVSNSVKIRPVRAE
jgi:hypothetical protein